MLMLFKLSLVIGMVVNLYYLHTKGDAYERLIREEKLKVRNLLLGMFLTILFWPIAIYNNEFRK